MTVELSEATGALVYNVLATIPEGVDEALRVEFLMRAAADHQHACMILMEATSWSPKQWADFYTRADG